MKGMSIRVGRVRRGLTQTELARRIGLSQTEVSKLERGIYDASVETATRIRQAFREVDSGNN
jgi:DNA-binding XRE family transcriptional regulator